MKKILTIVAVLMMAVTVSAQHEIGGIVGGLNGVSYKYWLNDNMAIQADLAAGLTRAAGGESFDGHYYSWDYGMWDFTVNPNFLYHWQLPANFKIYCGGGISFGMASALSAGDLLWGKFGINANVGAAYHFANIPLVLALDFRPGYGLNFRDANYGTRNYFDWKLAFAVRYAF